jgi:hypothetical protein
VGSGGALSFRAGCCNDFLVNASTYGRMMLATRQTQPYGSNPLHSNLHW